MIALMKWILRIFAVCVFLLLLLGVIGLLMPRDQSFTVSTQIAEPPQAVWNVLTDCAAQPAWRPKLRSCARAADEDGRTVYQLTYASGRILKIEVVESIPPENIEVRVLHLPAGGRLAWIFNLTPLAGGTQVSLTQNDEMKNLLARFIFRAVFRNQHPSDFLHALARKFDSSSAPS
ncbi:MAG: SRPBCC family protein [Candidatus Acidiferrales bacterium]